MYLINLEVFFYRCYHSLKLVHLCKGWQTLNKANSFSEEGHIYWTFFLLIALKLDCFHSYILCLFLCISLSAGRTFSIFRASVYPLTETFQMLLDLVNIVCQERLHSVWAFTVMFCSCKHTFEENLQFLTWIRMQMWTSEAHKSVLDFYNIPRFTSIHLTLWKTFWSNKYKAPWQPAFDSYWWYMFFYIRIGTKSI